MDGPRVERQVTPEEGLKQAGGEPIDFTQALKNLNELGRLGLDGKAVERTRLPILAAVVSPLTISFVNLFRSRIGKIERFGKFFD